MAQGSILNNISALGASRQLGITGQGMDKTIQRLTSGKRINVAQDDAAGLAISNRLGADIRISVQARRNAYDGIGYLAVADGALDEVTNLLTRGAELAEQAATGTINSRNRQALDLEFQNIKLAIKDVGNRALFNSASVFTNAKLFVSVADFSKITLTVGTMTGNFSTSSAISTDSLARTAKDEIKNLLQSVSMQRASLGATQQYLTTIANTLGIQVENFTAAFSQIRDANIADEVISLTKYQILNQSGISALGQSNQAAQSILGLLR
jgi:flagellin